MGPLACRKSSTHVIPHPRPIFSCPSSPLPSLVERSPSMTAAEIAESLVPPRQFEQATLENYEPDPDYPSQARAVERVRAFAAPWTASRGLFAKRPPETKPGLYLDGGFGVGKTHLLAALWKLAPGRTYFGTFIEFTALVGALGYAATVKLLGGATVHRDRRVRARRSGRHDDDDPPARRVGGRRNPHRGDIEHPAERVGRGPVRSRRLPARDPGALRPVRDREDRRTRLPPPRRREPRGRARRGRRTPRPSVRQPLRVR